MNHIAVASASSLQRVVRCGAARPLIHNGQNVQNRTNLLAKRTIMPSKYNVINKRCVTAKLFPFDTAWSPNINTSSIAPQLFALSLFPYLAFLFYLHRSGKTPRLTLVGFYFLLLFVGATIPAGIYAKNHYGTSLANVDWLHGSAESLLTITNLLIVLGLRQGIREAEQKASSVAVSEKKANEENADLVTSKQQS